jgi:catechol 2,3-dioxygenase-like lactoylglutathione lyase family enzyme
MIDHVGFPVSDYARAEAFYTQALAPLGYGLIMEVPQDANGCPACGFGMGGKPDFWIGGEGGLQKPLHIAIAARSRAEVDAFYSAALAAAAGTTGHPACGRIITPTITGPSCSIPTATTSKRSVTCRPERRNFRAATSLCFLHPA